MLTSLSHDLKTPLAAILGAASTLRDFSDKLDDASRVELLATVIDESERLNRFIANLLDMTKLEAGAIAPKAEVHDVSEIVDATLKRAKKLLAHHNVKYNVAAGNPLVKADPVLLEQVLFNVLDNAAKYAPEGTAIQIDVWTDFDRVMLQVRDEGPGIPSADLERIFDKFYRANKADHVRAGTGLGLPISRGFIEIMGGTITAANRLDRSGAVFSISLPTGSDSDSAGPRSMSAPPLKVLVIDDEPPIRKLLRMGLATQGYQVIDAPNAKIALEQMAQKPDFVILDLGLPDMQGLDLLRALREQNEAVPIVVLSSRADESAKVQALDFGADDYVTKPFGINELLARIRAAVRHQLQSHGERPIFRVGELSVDLVRRIVKVGEQDVKLSPKEYDLLRLFVQHAGKVLTHNFLLRELWGPSADSQYVRVYVRQLRQKIEEHPDSPEYILTETGVGYRLRVPD